MPRSQGRKLAVLALSAALAAVQSACSSDPTSEKLDPPSLATGPVLSVGGPDSIYVSGTYTYGAYFGAPYAWFAWWTRSCPTLSLTSCTATWNQVADASMPDPWRSQIRRFLTYSCTPTTTKSFQVKVTAGGFGQPAQTKFKVTKLCGSNPLA